MRPAASGRSSDSATARATSSTQTGWIRAVPSPMIGVTGARRARRRKVASAPPSPKTKLGRRITNSSPDSRTACSISRFASKYGIPSARGLSTPFALMSTRRVGAAAATRFRVPCAITRSKSAFLPVRIETRWTIWSQPSAAARRLAGSVTSPATTSTFQLASEAARAGEWTSARTSRSRARSSCTTRVPMNPAAPVTRITARSSASSGSLSGPSGPDISSRARRCRTGAPRPRSAA